MNLRKIFGGEDVFEEAMRKELHCVKELVIEKSSYKRENKQNRKKNIEAKTEKSEEYGNRGEDIKSYSFVVN